MKVTSVECLSNCVGELLNRKLCYNIIINLYLIKIGIKIILMNKKKNQLLNPHQVSLFSELIKVIKRIYLYKKIKMVDKSENLVYA